MMESLAGGAVTLHSGDCLDVMARMAPDTFHACLTDPPYHFGSVIKRWSNSASDDVRAENSKTGAYGRHSRGFMGQKWDGGDIAFRPETWAAVMRALKPGAHLVAFGAPKNVHRLTCAIEDAGFEIRDQLLWVFGVGFPKNHDAKKAMGKASDVDLFREALGSAAGKWDGWGTALKPAYEPIILARKPLAGTVQENLREHGCGALNIDACRVSHVTVGGGNLALNPHLRNSINGGNGGQIFPAENERRVVTPHTAGRWPANLLHDGSDEVVECFPAQAGALAPVHRRNADKFRNTYGAFQGDVDEDGSTFRGDEGSAARFFYCTKATDGERVFRCRECGAHQVGKPKCGHKKFDSHPTVKPISLLRYLARLIVPAGGLVLDPFAGTGTTAHAVLSEGGRAVLIENEAPYQGDIRQRMGALLAGAGGGDSTGDRE
jgi:site-specific DNA-methyltransferase (adenine-specific)